MSSVVIAGNTSGTVTLLAPDIAGTTTLTLPTTSGTILTTASGQWITTGSNIYYNTGNVGIGTSSPSAKLDVVGAGQFTVDTNGTSTPLKLINNSTTGTVAAKLAFQNGGSVKASINAAVYNNDYMTFNVGSDTERMRIDSSGNVGIGTSSPAVNLQIGSDTSTVRALAVRYSSVPVYLSNSFDGTLGLSTLSNNTYNTSNGSSSWSSFSNTSYGSSAVQLTAAVGGADIRFLTAAASNTNPSERMRIDSSGYVLVGCTAYPSSSVAGAALSPSVVSVNPHRFSVGSGTGVITVITFVNGNGIVGAINTSGSNTVYSTSSDYRLKDNIAPMTGALNKVALLKPCTYTWKADGSAGEGFIAHELAEVFPDAVVGEKDAVDADGEIKAQSIDTSFLVATLTAAIQEQQAIINEQASTIAAFEARLTALENK